MTIKKKSGQPSKLGKVMNPSGKADDFPGQIKAKWTGIKGNKTYVSHKSPDGKDNWTNTECTSTKAKMTITGLIPETITYLRFAATNSLGKGAWSNTIRVMAG